MRRRRYSCKAGPGCKASSMVWCISFSFFPEKNFFHDCYNFAFNAIYFHSVVFKLFLCVLYGLC